MACLGIEYDQSEGRFWLVCCVAISIDKWELSRIGEPFSHRTCFYNLHDAIVALRHLAWLSDIAICPILWVVG